MNELYQDNKVSVRVKIIGLWLGMMMLYIYNDFFHLFPDGAIAKIMNGEMGPLEITQVNLLFAAILMAIPVVLAIVTMFFSVKIIRLLNIVFGVIYTVVNISNLIGESWMFWFLLGAIQIVFTIMIVGISLKWPKVKQTVKVH